MPTTATPSQAHPNAPAPLCAAATSALAQAATLILQAFAQFVFSRFHVIGEPAGIALHRRIVRAYRRFQHLLALAALGREPRRYIHGPNRPTARRQPSPRLPRRRGWGSDLLGYQGNAFGSQLHHLLTQPETIALLRAAPARTRIAAARALGPILHMFAWPLPDVLQQAGPPRPRRKRPRSEPKPRWPSGQRRPITHPYPMLPGDKPLQPYVRRASRAWKKSPVPTG
jgi:hypothetical protein